MNVRQAAASEIKSWTEANPRQRGETLTAYRRRARKEIGDNLSEKYDGSPWLMILLQLLPLLIEWFINRRS